MLWICAFSAGAFATPRVQADVLNLRESRSATTEVVARLRIGTEVQILETDGDWVRVSVVARPANHLVQGWAKAAFVSEDSVHLPDLVRKARQAGSPAVAVKWLERAVALDAANQGAWAALESAHAQLGDQAGLRRVTAFREGRLPLYVAACANGRATLMERWTAKGGLESLASQGAPHTQAATLLQTAGTWAWLTADGAAPTAVSGTPFVKPWRGPFWNEAALGAYALTPCPKKDGEQGMCEDEPGPMLRLGPCPKGTSLLTTLVTTEHEVHEDAGPPVPDEPLPRVNAWRIPAPGGPRWLVHGDSGINPMAEGDHAVMGLVDEGGRLQQETWTWAGAMEAPRAFAIRLAGEQHALVVSRIRHVRSMREAMLLWLIRPDGTVEHVEAGFRGAGC